jgi:hypothetical protein
MAALSRFMMVKLEQIGWQIDVERHQQREWERKK